jgi:hypothetical protein
MLTSLLAIKIAGVVITTEQLISAGFAALFLASEGLASNPKIKSNAVYQLVLGILKRNRKEDDQIVAIKDILNGGGR